MAPEITVLLWSIVLAFVYLVIHGQIMRMQVGFRPDNSNRDHDPEPNLYSGRAMRALRNFLETYPVFIALVVVLALTHRSTGLTGWGAWIWLAARTLYLPAYIFGFGRSRSAIWMISLAGLGLMLIGPFGY
nr:MAPEG family protein [uncultured Gellertiella sp.]